MHSYMAILEHIQVPNFSAYWAINMQQCMFCHLVTLWLPRWFSAKIFAFDCSLGKKMFWNHFDGWKTGRDMLSMPFSCIYHDFCHTCDTVTRQKIDTWKTLPLGSTKKMGLLDSAFQIWCSVDIFKTKYNKNKVLEQFFWPLHRI